METYELAVAVMVKTVLDAIQEEPSFKQAENVLRPFADGGLREAKIPKREQDELRWVVGAYHSVPWELRDLERYLVRAKADELSVVWTFSGYSQDIWWSSEAPGAVVLGWVFAQHVGLHAGWR